MNKEILEITRKFHDTYEKLASEYTYETREDTKVFDINSNNGKLMYATVNEIVSPILKENKILRENAENNDKVVDKVNWENQKLKKQVEEANEKILLLQASEPMLEYKKVLEENQQKQFIEWLENEKDRLTRECSPTYKYSLGKTRFVNEDIFNEVDKILSKYKESCK